MGSLELHCMPEYDGGLTMNNSSAIFTAVTPVLIAWGTRTGRRIVSRESPLETTGPICCEVRW